MTWHWWCSWAGLLFATRGSLHPILVYSGTLIPIMLHTQDWQHTHLHLTHTLHISHTQTEVQSRPVITERFSLLLMTLDCYLTTACLGLPWIVVAAYPSGLLVIPLSNSTIRSWVMLLHLYYAKTSTKYEHSCPIHRSAGGASVNHTTRGQ